MKFHFRSVWMISFLCGRRKCWWWRQTHSTLSVAHIHFVTLASCCVFIRAAGWWRRSCGRFRPIITKLWKFAAVFTVCHLFSRRWRAGGFRFQFFSLLILILTNCRKCQHRILAFCCSDSLILVTDWYHFAVGCRQLYTRTRMICAPVWAIPPFRLAY